MATGAGLEKKLDKIGKVTREGIRRIELNNWVRSQICVRFKGRQGERSRDGGEASEGTEKRTCQIR